MKRLLATIFFTGILILSFPQKNEPAQGYLANYTKAENLFQKAERLSDKADFDDKSQELQDKLYHEALNGFQQVIKEATNKKNDSLSFHAFIKVGLINHYFDNTEIAKENYRRAIAIKSRLPNIRDSFLFKPYLFLGGILYDEHEFDSALIYFQKAEKILNNYLTPLEESQRLYNKLGAIYYETGNYNLARTYFEKALSVLQPSQPSYRSLMINYKINIASILVKLQRYNEAKKVYEAILPYKIYENEIWHNIGIIDNHLGKFRKAVEDFKKVSYENGNKNVDLYYNLAVVYDSLRRPDSVNAYLQKAFSENKKINGDQKNTAYGLALKFYGDKLMKRKNSKKLCTIVSGLLYSSIFRLMTRTFTKTLLHFPAFSHTSIFLMLLLPKQGPLKKSMPRLRIRETWKLLWMLFVPHLNWPGMLRKRMNLTSHDYF